MNDAPESSICKHLHFLIFFYFKGKEDEWGSLKDGAVKPTLKASFKELASELIDKKTGHLFIIQFICFLFQIPNKPFLPQKELVALLKIIREEMGFYSSKG